MFSLEVVNYQVFHIHPNRWRAAILVYTQGIHIDIPSYQQSIGFTAVYPIKLLYVSNIL
jgi:energy-converting hydrogenase Eha subunit G